MTKKYIRQYVRFHADNDREYIDGTKEQGVAWFSKYYSDAPSLVYRIEITRSPWWKKNRPNYTVRYLFDGKLTDCENGLNLDAVVRCVQSFLS